MRERADNWCLAWRQANRAHYWVGIKACYWQMSDRGREVRLGCGTSGCVECRGFGEGYRGSEGCGTEVVGGEAGDDGVG